MEQVELIKLADIPNDIELWRGTKIRILNDGTNFSSDDHHFDYILVQFEERFFHLVNVTEDNYKTGAIYVGKAPIDSSSNKMVTTKKGLKAALGNDFINSFLFLNSQVIINK